MDEKDKKILNELDKNSRTPINQLAKKVGVSKEVANYRLKNLVKNKIILDFHTQLNLEALGLSRYGCAIQLKGVSNKLEKEIIDYIADNEYANYLGPLIGKWNLAFDLIVKDRTQLEDQVTKIKADYHQYIESLILINASPEFESFPLKFLGYKREEPTAKKKSTVNLDDQDIKLLELLAGNSRAEYSSLSSKLNLSANAIKYRIKNLEKSGVILGYSITVDPIKLGFIWQNIQIKLASEQKSDQIKQFLRSHRNVTYYYKHLGNENWDLDIGIVAENALAVRQFILELRERFGEIMKVHDIYTIIEMTKSNIIPKGVFKDLLANKKT